MNVNADHRTAGGSGDSQRRTSCSTSNIEQCLPWRKFEPLQKPVLLARGEPTILSNILAKSFTTDLCVQFRLKIPVVGMVVTGVGQRVGFAHLDLHSKRPRDIFQMKSPINAKAQVAIIIAATTGWVCMT